ncbi:alpha-fibrinogenase-like [Aphomia sociella]
MNKRIYILYILFCYSLNTIFSIESRVFDGHDLRFDVHKYLVKLKIHHSFNDPSRCSGSIIDHSWIITAAHCFCADVETVNVFHQVEDSVRVIAKVDKSNITLHPSYIAGDTSIDNRLSDIALMKTSAPIKFSYYVQPIKLTKNHPRVGQTAIIAGYGNSEDDLADPKEGYIVLSQCPYNANGLICSVDTVRAGSGDSGGSLLTRGRLIGITSASCKDVHIHKSCLTVYVNVVTNLDWIQKVVMS